MRWPVVRLIANRETRDQLRDRRTLFMILGLPVLMYPLFLGVGIAFISILKEKKLTVGVVGVKYLPTARPDISGFAGAAAGTVADLQSYPPFIVGGEIIPRYSSEAPETLSGQLFLKPLTTADEAALSSRAVDAILVIDDNLANQLLEAKTGNKPIIRVMGRDGEENSKLAVSRVMAALRRWNGEIKAVRFFRAGVPLDFDIPLEIRDPQSDKSSDRKKFDELRDMLVKIIPMLLVMWVLTGTIYPAVDMTAGEKERGTMETLLISPAERSEIVIGKFLAVTTLGFGTGLWNIMLIVVAVICSQFFFPNELVSIGGLSAGIFAALPLAMVFAAGCLSLGVFARSTKEGNYYMVPMFFLVLPLAYWSMAPGIELDAKMCWVPVTNALLLQQRLMSVRPDPFPWQHVPAVVVSLAACITIGLRVAIMQFQREGVLFREVGRAGSPWSFFRKKPARKEFEG